MNVHQLSKHFNKIGAQLELNLFNQPTGRWARELPDYSIDVLEEKNNERFLLNIDKQLENQLTFIPVDVRAKQRHLLLYVNNPNAAKQNLIKQKFLCGHDERHWFVAGIENANGITNVFKVMESLKPEAAQQAQISKKIRKKNRNKRHNRGFVRQGEWFFIPTPGLKIEAVFPTIILKNEPLRRGNVGKPHCLTERNYKKHLKNNPKAKFLNWTIMRRNAKVYARGRVKHKDHATITLTGWHEVCMNKEFFTETVAFLD